MPEEEAVVEASSAGDKQAEFRPQRMGLGCSKEMIQEKISANARKSRLTKLLERQENETEEIGNATSSKLKRSRLEEDSEDELSKTALVAKKSYVKSTAVAALVESAQLSKSQRKRMKQKLKDQQKKLINS